MEDEWGQPTEVGGEFIKPKDLRGHLLIVFPIGYVPHIQTRFSSPDKKSDAITVDVIDLDDKDEYGAPGKIYRNSNWMQSQLIVGLRSLIGSKALGRIDLGMSRNGMNAPWVFNSAAEDSSARERASAWLREHPHFAPTVFSLREQSSPQQETVQQRPPQNQYDRPAPSQPAQSYGIQQPAPYQDRAQVPRIQVEQVDEEQTVLQRLREIQAEKARAQQAQFQDEPPF